MLKKVFLLFLLFLLIPFNFANNYYADLEIDILDDGSTTIIGITNYNELKNITNSQIYTSKQGEYWLFNLTTNQLFEDFIFKLNLPENVEINYIKTTPHFRIEDSGDSLSIVGLGSNKELNILVQYKINNQYSMLSHEQIIAFLTGLLVFTIVFGIVVGIKYYFGPVKTKEPKENTKINLDILPQRQREIVKIIEKHKKISQKELQKIMQIPKSSVSRNVNSLAARQILEKERSGVTIFLSLKE